MEKLENQMRDFVVASNNGVAAVYVVNPEILALDDKTQRGKPFLFYCQRHQQNKNPRDIEDGMGGFKPYVGNSAGLDALLNGRKDVGKVPDVLDIDGEKVKTETLCSGYVPFSFGVYHESDVKEQRESRVPIVRMDLPQFKEVLKRYDAMKEYEAMQKRKISYKLGQFFRWAHIIN